MHKIKAGVMIYQVRVQKKIRQNRLCAGLCTPGTLSKYENGEIIPDGLLFHCFMQRMGMNPGDFAVIFSAEEYRYYIWKESVFEAIQKQDWETAERLCHDEMAANRRCNAKIQNQFYLYISSVLAEKREGNNGKALRLLREAIGETVPFDGTHGWEAYQLSSFEIGLTALYYYKGGIMCLLPKDEVFTGLKSLMDYTGKVITDQQERARLAPGIVCALLCTCREMMTVRERLSLEESAVNILKESYRLYHLPELLRFYCMDLREAGQAQAEVYGKQYGAFLEAFGDAGYNTAFQPELLYDNRQQIYLLNEYMRSCREISGLTQEQISEGICAVETYSRLETGKRAPHRKEREAIMERLDIGWGFFRGDLETTDYKAFENLHRYKEAVARKDWKKAGDFLEKIRVGLDMESVGNRQFVGAMENLVALKTGKINVEEFFRKDKELLGLSIKEENLEKTELYYFSYVEMILYAHMANALGMQGKKREGITLLSGMLKKLEKSQVGFEYWWEGLKVSIFNLANMLSDIKEYRASLDYMEDFVPMCFKLGDGKYMGYGIGERAFDLDKLELSSKATCYRLLVQAFYITGFYDLKTNHNRLKEYMEHYEKLWYK